MRAEAGVGDAAVLAGEPGLLPVEGLVRQIADAFLCPDLLTAEQYRKRLQSAGMTVVCCETLACEVSRTWDICAERLHTTRWLLTLLPRRFRAFQKSVELMREGFRSGQLDYTVLVAQKPV